MVKDNYAYDENERKVYKIFECDALRHDHYSDGNGIYRFDALAYFNCSCKNDIGEVAEEILERLYKLEVKPSRMSIFEDCIEVSWEANGFQIVSSKEQYLKLSLEFAKFLDSANIKELKLNEGSFDDDPEYTEPVINLNPKFDNTCFGSNEIKVIDWRGHNF